MSFVSLADIVNNSFGVFISIIQANKTPKVCVPLGVFSPAAAIIISQPHFFYL